MSMFALMASAAAVVPPGPSPTDFDLFAWLDTSLDAGAVVEPGVDADFLASSPSVGSLSHSWVSTTTVRQPFRERTTGAAYFRTNRRITSSAAAAEWTWLHDGTTYGKFGLTFRLTSRSGTSDLLCTFNTTGDGPGVAFQVLSDGKLRALVGNGSTVYTGETSAGAVQVGVDYRLVVSKLADFLLVYLFSADSGVLFGILITEPSSEPPGHTLSIGSAVTISPSRAVRGWIPKAMFFVGAKLPSDELLARFVKQDMSGLVTPLPVSLVWSVDRSDTTYESGSTRRIQTIQNSGNLGGTRTQSTAADRPWAVRFPSGLVDYFPGGSVSVVSSLSPVAFTTLHGDGLEASLFFRFRIDDLSSNQRIVRTMTASNSNIGIIIQVQTDGRVRVFVGNGSGTAYAIDTFSGPGHVQEGVDYTIAFIKTPSSMALYLEDMATPLLSGALSSLSSDAPSETLTMGQAGNRIHGWVSELVMLEIDANQAQRETVAARLARHNFGASVADLISGYASDGLAHAYTPSSLQVSGSDVTAWNDVVGSQPLAVLDGNPVSLDGLAAVELGAFSGLSNDTGVAAIASGTDKAFAVVDYGQWVAGAYTLWQFGGNGAHWWGIGGSNHRVGREDDGALNFDESNAIGATTAQRFFAHSFHSADGPNLFQVDGASEAAPLDINPVTTTEFGTTSAGPGATIRLAYRLLFDRALNVGELTQLREAFLRAVA